MNKTSWVERKTNEQVSKDVREKRDIMKHVLKRKAKLIGHQFRRSTFIRNVFEGKMCWEKDLEDAQEHHISKTSMDLLRMRHDPIHN